MKVLERYAFVAFEGERAVGLVDWETLEDGAAGLGLVMDPSHRNLGYGRGILEAAMAHSHMDRVRCARAGIKPNNVPSVRCFEAAGFRPETSEPDHEGFIYFSREVH